MKKQILLFLLMLLPMVASADDTVEINGMFFSLSSNGKATVENNPNYYSGNVTIPEKVKYQGKEYTVNTIGEQAFVNCRDMTSVTIPNSVTSFRGWSFANCTGLTSVTIPNSVEIIGAASFSGCKNLVSITLSENLMDIREYVFRNCSSLKSLTIPNSVTMLSELTFENCTSLTSIVIPNSVTTIGKSFVGCTNLATITIGSSVRKIELLSFSNCTKMKTVYCLSKDVPSTSADAFQDSNPQNATLYVPASSLNDYKTTVPWSYFGTIKALDEGAGIETPHSALPMILGQDGLLTIQGADEGTHISIYGANGMLAGETVSRNGCATVNTNLQPGSVAIIKIGTRSVKVVIK